MKNQLKQALSLFLALILTVTMIPLGVVITSAEDAKSYDISKVSAEIQQNVNATNVALTIRNADEWCYIAEERTQTGAYTNSVYIAEDLDFAGKVVKGPLFTNFRGVFEGNGHILSNITMAKGSGTGYALLSGAPSGGSVVRNIKIDTIVIPTEAQYTGVIYGRLDDWSKGDSFSGITIKNASISSTKASYSSIGMIAGYVRPYGVIPTFKDVNVAGSITISCVTTNAIYIGGIVGNFFNNQSYSDVYKFENVTTDVDIAFMEANAVNNAAMLPGIGGLVGRIEASGSAGLDIQVAGGTIKTDVDASGSDLRVGGLFGYNVWSAASNKIVCSNLNVTTSVEGKGSYAGGAIGKLEAGTASNEIRFTDSTFNTTIKESAGYSAAGGVVGEVRFDNISNTFTVEDCKINSNINLIAGTNVGGVVGRIISNGAANATATGSQYVSYNFRNLRVASTISDSNTADGSHGTGGVIGETYLDQGGVNLTISGCYVTGSIASSHVAGSNANYSHVQGGVIARMWFDNSNSKATSYVNIDHTVVDAIVTGNTSNCVFVGQAQRFNVKWTMNNNYYTGDLNLFRESYGTSVINGVTLSSDKYANTADIAIKVDAEQAENLVKTDSNGFIISVADFLQSGYCQDNVKTQLTGSDRYMIRFIALSQLDEIPANAKVGMKVVFKNSEAVVVKTFETQNCEIYDQLSSYGADGAKLESYKASDFGAEKFIAVVVKNIPAGVAYSCEVTTNYTTAEGVVITGETYVISYAADGSFVSSVPQA